MQGAYILSAVRTPIGKFGGTLASLTAADMGVVAAKAAIERAGVQAPQVEETIFGNARQAGGGPNPARQISVRSGVPDEVPAFTVNKACASGMKAIALAYQAIVLVESNCILAGGTESMSRLPYYLDGARWGYRLGNQELVDGMYRDGFMCPMAKMVMGETAELLARKYRITREEQDALALESHRRAAAAAREGRFRGEIAPVEIADRKGKTTVVKEDEHVRADVTPEALAKLPAVFDKAGTITAGNSSGITDGASAVVLTSGERMKELDLKPLVRIHDAAIAAVDPREMGIGPVPAVRELEQRTGWKITDYATVELNEAFAAQVIACDRELGFDRARLNPNGGAIALGHPIGATGARITTTMAHELSRGNGAGPRRGLVTLCVSGGLGMALALESM